MLFSSTATSLLSIRHVPGLYRYGYTPIPKFIAQKELDQALKQGDDPAHEAIRCWYALDLNAVPPCYVLKNLQDKDDPKFWKDSEAMLRVMTGLPFDQHNYEGLLVGHRCVLVRS